MRDIHLYGDLAAQFGKDHRFAVDTIGEVIDALRANYPKFSAAIREGFYKVVLGKSKSNGLALTEKQAERVKIGNRAVHIIPTVQGRGRGGLGKIIAGIALIGLSIFTGGALLGPLASYAGNIGAMGAAMTLNGVATLISPQQEAGDDKKSYTMSGPVSNLREGNIVPIVYGKVVTSGYMISGQITIDGAAGTDKPQDKDPISGFFDPNRATGGSAMVTVPQ